MFWVHSSTEVVNVTQVHNMRPFDLGMTFELRSFDILGDVADTIASYQARIEEVSFEKEEVEQKLINLEGDLQDKADNNEALQTEIRNLKRKIKDLELELNLLRGNHEATKLKLEEEQKEHKMTEQELNKLKEKLEAKTLLTIKLKEREEKQKKQFAELQESTTRTLNLFESFKASMNESVSLCSDEEPDEGRTERNRDYNLSTESMPISNTTKQFCGIDHDIATSEVSTGYAYSKEIQREGTSEAQAHSRPSRQHITENRRSPASSSLSITSVRSSEILGAGTSALSDEDHHESTETMQRKTPLHAKPRIARSGKAEIEKRSLSKHIPGTEATASSDNDDHDITKFIKEIMPIHVRPKMIRPKKETTGKKTLSKNTLYQKHH